MENALIERKLIKEAQENIQRKSRTFINEEVLKTLKANFGDYFEFDGKCGIRITSKAIYKKDDVISVLNAVYKKAAEAGLDFNMYLKIGAK